MHMIIQFYNIFFKLLLFSFFNLIFLTKLFKVILFFG